MKAKEHFNDTADRYEILIEQIVPHHDLFFDTAVDCIPDGAVSILELGSGTGYLTERILSKNPEAKITCIDMTPEMLAVARGKSTLRGVTFIEGDFRDVWPDGCFDAIITTLCLHHLPDADRAELVRRIHTTLKAGGRFINGDVFRPETEWEEAVYRKRWRRAMTGSGLHAEQADGMIEKRQHSYAFLDTLAGYRQKLGDAGFLKVFCPYIHDFYGVFCACR